MKKLALLFVFSSIFACNDGSPTGESTSTQVPVQIQGPVQSGPAVQANQIGQASAGLNQTGAAAHPSGSVADSSFSGSAVTGVGSP